MSGLVFIFRRIMNQLNLSAVILKLYKLQYVPHEYNICMRLYTNFTTYFELYFRNQKLKNFLNKVRSCSSDKHMTSSNNWSRRFCREFQRVGKLNISHYHQIIFMMHNSFISESSTNYNKLFESV